MEGTSNFQRGGGILLHPTSLPGPFGIGDLGPSARKFIDFLAESGLTYWQVLPLDPHDGRTAPLPKDFYDGREPLSDQS